MRRIITGHNENGKSIISADGPPARSWEDAGGLFTKSGILTDRVRAKSDNDRADIDIMFRQFKIEQNSILQINPIPEEFLRML